MLYSLTKRALNFTPKHASISACQPVRIFVIVIFHYYCNVILRTSIYHQVLHRVQAIFSWKKKYVRRKCSKFILETRKQSTSNVFLPSPIFMRQWTQNNIFCFVYPTLQSALLQSLLVVFTFQITRIVDPKCVNFQFNEKRMLMLEDFVIRCDDSAASLSKQREFVSI